MIEPIVVAAVVEELEEFRMRVRSMRATRSWKRNADRVLSHAVQMLLRQQGYIEMSEQAIAMMFEKGVLPTIEREPWSQP